MKQANARVERAAEQYQATLDAFDRAPARSDAWPTAIVILEQVDERDLPTGSLRDLHVALLAHIREVSSAGHQAHSPWSKFIDLISTLMWINYQLGEIVGVRRAHDRPSRPARADRRTSSALQAARAKKGRVRPASAGSRRHR